MTPITDVANLSPGMLDNFRHPLLNTIQDQIQAQINILNPFSLLSKENFSSFYLIGHFLPSQSLFPRRLSSVSLIRLEIIPTLTKSNEFY
jgi:hypothetical protein